MTKDEFKAWRKTNCETQDDAATKLGMGRRQIQKYESGAADVPLVVAFACVAIAAGLKP